MHAFSLLCLAGHVGRHDPDATAALLARVLIAVDRSLSAIGADQPGKPLPLRR